MATLTVFLAKDTSIVSYRISNESGEFKFSNLPINVPYAFWQPMSEMKPIDKVLR
jgi:hypothetical protein